MSVRDFRRVGGLIVGLGLVVSALSPTVAARDKSLSVRLISPASSQAVAGRVTFVVEVSADGLVSLQTRLDGRDYGSLAQNQTSGSYDNVIDTFSLVDGMHTVQVVAEDEFGNVERSTPAIILVNNRRSSAPLAMAPMVAGPKTFSPVVSIGNTVRTPTPNQNNTKTTAAPERPRVETMFSGGRSDVLTICRGKDPYANDGGGRCKSGEWVPVDPARVGDAANAVASREPTPAAAKPTTDAPAAGAKPSSSRPSPSGKVKAATVPCSEPDPFAARGGVGLCVDGTWLELWKAPAKTGRRGK